MNNKLCPNCVKSGTCMFEDKLNKLEATKNNPLSITVDDCDQYLSVNGKNKSEE